MINIYEEVKAAKRIAISGHLKPDGDCIGSCLGLHMYLRKRMPDAEIYVYLEEPSWVFKDIPGYKGIRQSFKANDSFDVFIALDTDPARMGNATEYYNKATKTINIDHHATNPDGKGMVNYMVPGASSASELVYNLIDEEYLDKDIATVLYMGIAHDTGVFRFSNTAPSTYAAAAKLVSYGFDFSKLLDSTFYEKTYEQNKAQGQIVIESRMYHNKKIIVGSADEDFMARNNVKKADFEGVVNQLLLTKGVVAALFMYAKAPGVVKLSLRSKTDDVNVAKVSAALGGGGHVRAAGCDFNGSMTEAEEKVVALIEEQL